MDAAKDFLKRQVAVPESIEKQLPAFAPKLSKVLYAVADSLPEIPLPGGLNTKAGATKLREFVSSAEEKVSEILPKFTPGVTERPTMIPEAKIVKTVPISKSYEEQPPAGFPVYGVDKRGTVDIE